MTGCSSGEGGASSFTSFGSAPGGSSPASSADEGDESAADTSGSDEDDSGDADGGSVSGTDGADSDTGDSTTGPAATTAAGSTDDGMDTMAGSSSDSGGMSGAQPVSGMWAHCVMDDFSNCGMADTCVYLDDNGFCTAQGCTNAGLDCDPAPAGTSVTPICADAVSTAVCALDCSTAACPSGMVCTTLSINMGPEYDLCI